MGQHPIPRNLGQRPGRDDLVNHAQAGGLVDGQRLAGQHQPRGRGDADQARQALRAAAARNQPQRDLGQAQPCARRIGRDAMMAGQGQLQSAAQGRAIDRRDKGLAASLHAAQALADLAHIGNGLGRGGGRIDRVQVAAGQKVPLGRRNNHPLDRRVGDGAVHGRHEGRHGSGVLDVHLPFGVVPDDVRHAIVIPSVVDHLPSFIAPRARSTSPPPSPGRCTWSPAPGARRGAPVHPAPCRPACRPSLPPDGRGRSRLRSH